MVVLLERNKPFKKISPLDRKVKEPKFLEVATWVSKGFMGIDSEKSARCLAIAFRIRLHCLPIGSRGLRGI